MNLTDLANAKLSDAAAFRRKWDLGLRWAGGPFGHPGWFNGDGCLMLRRWRGRRHPRPQAATVVGYAQRPATQVSSDGGATYGNDNIYWHVVDQVSPGGVLTQGSQFQAQPAVWGPSGYVGAIPNTPAHLRVGQVAGPKHRLVWLYNPVDEQVAPGRFDVFGDSGTGTMDWVTPLGQVNYVDGQLWYSYLTGTLADDTTYLYSVRARSAAGVYSLVPEIRGRMFLGAQALYTPTGNISARGAVETTAPPDPPAPDFIAGGVGEV